MEDKVEIKSNFEKEIVPNITGFRKIDLEEDDEHKIKRDKKELSDEDGES